MTSIPRILVWLALAAPLNASLRADVLAKVGPESITREDFDAAAAAEAHTQGHALGKEERLALLRSMVNQRLLVAEARARHLDRDPALKAQLAELERRALADKIYGQEVAAPAAVTLDQAKQYYDRNPGLFDVAEVSQIVVAPAAGHEDEREKRARDLKAKLDKAPKRFAELARSDSDDTLSKERGGDLGTLRRGMLLPELEAAVFGAKAGALVGPVKTQFGWHLLWVRSLKRMTWEQAGPSLQGELQRLRALQLQEALLERLAKDRKVTLSEEKL